MRCEIDVKRPTNHQYHWVDHGLCNSATKNAKDEELRLKEMHDLKESGRPD